MWLPVSVTYIPATLLFGCGPISPTFPFGLSARYLACCMCSLSDRSLLFDTLFVKVHTFVDTTTYRLTDRHKMFFHLFLTVYLNDTSIKWNDSLMSFSTETIESWQKRDSSFKFSRVLPLEFLFPSKKSIHVSHSLCFVRCRRFQLERMAKYFYGRRREEREREEEEEGKRRLPKTNTIARRITRSTSVCFIERPSIGCRDEETRAILCERVRIFKGAGVARLSRQVEAKNLFEWPLKVSEYNE